MILCLGLVSCSVIKEQEPETITANQEELSPKVCTFKAIPDSPLLRCRLQTDPELMMLRCLKIIDGKICATLSFEEATQIGIPENVFGKFTEEKE